MKEIRCQECNRFLGKIDGMFEIKCPRCHLINKGNADTGEIEKIYKSHVSMNERSTSSGVTFR